MKRYKKRFNEDEDDKSQSVIKDLIDMKTVNTDEEKGKFLSMIKGLVYANTPSGNKFLSAINDFTSTLKEDDFK